MTTSPSLIVIGAGITGLCIAVVAQARGLSVTLIARDRGDAIASGVAAGMIAPVLEALIEHEPDVAFARLKAAEQQWHEQGGAWGPALGDLIARARTETDSRYVWPQSDNASDITTPRLHAMGAVFRALTDDELEPVASDCDGVRVEGDWLVPAGAVLTLLEARLRELGGQVLSGAVRSVTPISVTLDDGTIVKAGHIVLAAGYDAAALAGDVPSLNSLSPIKGHLLELKAQGTTGVLRSPLGYLAGYSDTARFGATMQFGQTGSAIDAAEIDDLKARARQILPDLDLSDATGRAGVRASTPDGWPLIGRDPSGVLVAVGMRRNGYIFAPLAAHIVTALILGEALPDDAALYAPDRF
ncbi:NAD(P)/FAD-dependent oxidoreductase [Asticcacaulis solisilvae]|uniref:NAD(P)/FAD-dependent oxidoreductase n=1 Tax=Asticcacaulis solisilvae TaxID=1217274 RepID=UPI003FD77DA1